MFTEKSHPEATYHTAAINETGVNGQAYIQNEESFSISSPSSNAAGANPEQFLGLALATCLNATLEVIEKKNGYQHDTKVRADVYQTADTRGLKFLVDVTVYIPEIQFDHRTAESMFRLAESRCPVAKLLGQNDDVTFRLTNQWEE